MKRYVLAKPVDGGSEYFEITDTERNLTVATFFKDVPGADTVTEAMTDVLNYPGQ